MHLFQKRMKLRSTECVPRLYANILLDYSNIKIIQVLISYERGSYPYLLEDGNLSELY